MSIYAFLNSNSDLYREFSKIYNYSKAVALSFLDDVFCFNGLYEDAEPILVNGYRVWRRRKMLFDHYDSIVWANGSCEDAKDKFWERCHESYYYEFVGSTNNSDNINLTIYDPEFMLWRLAFSEKIDNWIIIETR